MRMIELIERKKHGEVLSGEEIEWFVRSFVSGEVPDYQASAFLMAVWFRGMDERETVDLTLAMARSGTMADLSEIPGIPVDKHSTGGVADTTTLVAAPLVAACGGRVAKMSGRGLGHTGGTLDKLESIPGFSVSQTMQKFIAIVGASGLAVIGQTGDICPADKKLYSLRDVTGTIDSIPLIAASIMSKKIASGSPAIVLDVKTGSGAFMKKLEDSRALANAMVGIGSGAGRRCVALVTDMSQPLGLAIGNALEVREAIEILRGERTGALLDVSIALAKEMLILSEVAGDREEAERMLGDALHSGKGLESLARMIRAQGGDPRVTENPDLLPQAREVFPILAGKPGWIHSMDTEKIGTSCLLLGAGRSRKEDVIDPAVGIWMRKRLGERVERGEEIARFHVNPGSRHSEAASMFTDSILIGADPIEPPVLIRETIRHAT